MVRTFVTAAILAATAAGGIAAAPADAQYYGGRGYGYDRGYDRGYGGGYDRGGYGYGYGRGYGYRPSGYDGRRHGWGVDRYGYACHDRGNGGLAIGAIAGGLLGHEIAGRGDRTLGTVLGGVGGGLIGRSIDRHDGRC